MNETKHVPAATADARAAMAEMLGAFEAFKAANDQRLIEIEARRPDVLLEEKVARIDAGLQAAQAKADRAASVAHRPALGGSANASAVGDSGADEGADERKAAWGGYMKAGLTAGLEAKGLAESAPSTGGYVAPPETERLIERRLMAASPMREICSVRTVGAGVYRKPYSIAAVASGWVAETAPRPETDAPTLNLLEFPSAELYACPAATQSLLDDAFVNLDEWLAAECEDAFAAQETAAFVGGDGVNKPKGFLSYPTVADVGQVWGQLGFIGTGAAGAFPGANPADKLMDLAYLPGAQYRPGARFVMNRRTTSTIRKFKDTTGAYIWSPGTLPGQAPSLLGYPVTEIETMPDMAANSVAIAFGDFARGYLIVDRAGMRVLRDPFTAKPYVLFYTTKRVGGGVQNFDAIKLLKFG